MKAKKHLRIERKGGGVSGAPQRHETPLTESFGGTLVAKIAEDSESLSVDAALSICGDSEAWNVIGVTGKSGCGCTTVASSIAGLCGSAGMALMASGKPTSAMDIAVAVEGTVVLDVSPKLQADRVRVLAAMMSVCHTVVVVQDRLSDPTVSKALEAACTLRAQRCVPDVGAQWTDLTSSVSPSRIGQTVAANDRKPEIVIVVNRLTKETLPLTVDEEAKAIAQIAAGTPPSLSLKGVFIVPDASCEELCANSMENRLGEITSQLLSAPTPFRKPISQRDWVQHFVRVWDRLK